jgi:uncharacterized protein YbjT (DUF2867 family)
MPYYIMTKILVTGATGIVGKSTVEHLLKKGVPASQIIGLSRKKENLEDLAAKGVEIREGDYIDYNRVELHNPKLFFSYLLPSQYLELL